MGPTDTGAERPGAGSRPTVSVVLPARNEREGIEATLAEVRRVLAGCDVDYELIVVDDGSTDGTFDQVRGLVPRDPQLRGIRLSRNYGKESALLAGIRAATGDAVITMDADLQHPPSVIPQMLARWRAGARVVHGIKRRPEGGGWATRLGARTFNRLVWALSGIDMREASDFILLDREVAEVLARGLPETQRFYRGLARWVGFRQETVAFDVVPRPGGGSRWSLPGLFELALTGLVSFTRLPLRLVTLLGLGTLVFAVVVAAETLWSWVEGRSVSGFATIEITLLLVGSAVMISLGVLGEYVGRIYDEVKRRPGYLVEERCGFQAPESAAGRSIAPPL